jgi:effector-binding domain-containing protein
LERSPIQLRPGALHQLTDLSRVLALRDLGIGLESIRELLEADESVSVEQLRGMLRLRQAEISSSIAEQHERLRRVAGLLSDDVRVVELAGVEVASAIHRRPMVEIVDTFEAIVRWIEASGYRIADRSRELYLAWDADDYTRSITELQLPIIRN